MKANCASAGLPSFLGDNFTPTCLVLHTDCHIFGKIFFSSIIDASINLARTFPLRMKKKIQQQQQQKQKKEKKEEKLNLWIYNVLKNMFIMLLS